MYFSFNPKNALLKPAPKSPLKTCQKCGVETRQKSTLKFRKNTVRKPAPKKHRETLQKCSVKIRPQKAALKPRREAA